MANEVVHLDVMTKDVVNRELQKRIEEEWRLCWLNFIMKNDCSKHHSISKYLTFEFALKHKDHVDWSNFNRYGIFRLLHVINHPELPWNWDIISANSNITMKDVEANLDKPWNYNHMSCNKSVTCDFIEKNITENWNWCALSWNLAITENFVEKHFDKPWNWECLSENVQLSFDFIEKWIDKPWNFIRLSYRKDFSISLFEKYPTKDWSVSVFFEHPDMTFDFIQNSKYFQYAKIALRGYMGQVGNFDFDQCATKWINSHIVSILIATLHDFYNNPSTYNNHNTISITNVERILHDAFITKTIFRYI
jgi:hypothetical protein